MPSVKGNILILASFLIIAIFLYICFTIWRESEEGAYHSCIGSVTNAIQKTNETKTLAANNTEWKVLDSQEIDFLMSKTQAGDCKNYKNPTFDIWHNRINIALKNSAKFPDIIVWSNGADGISGTDDDLVVPFGQKVPQ